MSAVGVADARACGRVVKLIAALERTSGREGREGLHVRVHPAMIERAHPHAAVPVADNAVLVEAADAGPSLFCGAGTDGVPTFSFSAVIGDVVTAGRRRLLGHYDAAPAAAAAEHPGSLPGPRTRYHLRVPVGDGAAALGEVTAALRTEGPEVLAACHAARLAARKGCELLTVARAANCYRSTREAGLRGPLRAL
ncbi:hypothetical protein [Streptomyces sp. NBC_00212]|uniref:hypothetical protein n=1 Tax=Streptomyces sp. NBC_00212 TaxID=2975684 RepID=UPI003251A1EF